ncbi:MAG: hypothetical protein F6K28_08335 [Microcoleus sp. SIO2G3]|nr:hypothetical protein [Microcoleus sp. SIO2G3]
MDEVIPSLKSMVQAAKILWGKLMRPENRIWQGNFGYWQNEFIQQNLLAIG